MASSEQACRLAIVLGNMQQKRLLRLRQVEALKANQQALGLLAEFISAGSQDLNVLEKRILELTDKPKNNEVKNDSKQNGYTLKDSNNNNNISKTSESQDNKGKSGSIDEIQDENESNQNVNSITPSRFYNASKLHSLSHIEQFFTYDQADVQKASSQVNLSGGKQQTYQYLRSLHSSGDLQQSEEEFEKMCEEMLVRLLNPDAAELKGIYDEIGQLLTAKKTAIKDKVQGATISLLKASVLNCDIFHIVRQTKEILGQLFCICDFEVARYHEAQVTTFSSRTVAQQTGESKNIDEWRENIKQYTPGKVCLLTEPQKQQLESAFTFEKNSDAFLILKSYEAEVLLYVFHVSELSKTDSFFKLLENSFDNSFHNIFKEQISSLLGVFVRDKDYLQKKYLHKLIKVIEEFVKKSELIIIEDIRQCFQSYFDTQASITFGWEQLKQIRQHSVQRTNQANEAEDSCKYEISIPIAKISLKCNLNKTHAQKLLHLLVFEKVMTAVYCEHHQKIKALLSRFTNYTYFLRNSEIVLMEFNKKRELTFISQTLNPSTIESLHMKILDDKATNLDQSYYFNYADIFQSNPTVLKLINQILEDPSIFSLRTEGEPRVEFLVNPSNNLGGPRGFRLFLWQQENTNLSTIPILPVFGSSVKEKHFPQVSKIKRAMHKLSFITRTSKTAISKDLVLSDPNVKNSYVREYLPDRDLIKIQEDERQQHKGDNGIVSKATQQPRLFNPQTTIHKISDILVTTQNISKPQISDFVLKEKEDAQLDLFKFDVFKADQREKVRIIWSIFQKRNYFEKYKIPMPQFCEFIQQIRYKYNKHGNPFHNFDHGITVMHGCYVLSCQTAIQSLIPNLNEFALIFAGLCHDVSHTARTNLFEVNSMSKLAIRYHDKSVLEQHHLAVTFKILHKKEANILQMMPLDQMLQFRKIVISNIMATDIKQHFDLLKEFELRFGSKRLKSRKGSSSHCLEGEDSQQIQPGHAFSESDVALLTNMVIHAADFHGNAQEFEISKRWSLLVNQEFQAQFKEESEKNIVQTMYLKDLDKRDTLARSEIGFISAIVQPLWELLNKFLGDDLGLSTYNLSNNIMQWEAIAKECSQSETVSAPSGSSPDRKDSKQIEEDKSVSADKQEEPHA